ncbi:uncharacterized protein VTP21DRAFT_2836 [Calcarisporiella thermophila]|uniref:uncharacterized protein n=1 Tax=Calcarisporiella thermophila TaxID=911321 RepID=UPI0037421E3A
MSQLLKAMTAFLKLQREHSIFHNLFVLLCVFATLSLFLWPAIASFWLDFDEGSDGEETTGSSSDAPDTERFGNYFANKMSVYFFLSLATVLGFLWIIWRIHYHRYSRRQQFHQNYKSKNTKTDAKLGSTAGSWTEIFSSRSQSLPDFPSVRVQTLKGKHIADVECLEACHRGILVSCGLDGRVVVWDAKRAVWTRHLDKVVQQTGGRWVGLPNDKLQPAANTGGAEKTIRRLLDRISVRCAKIDPNGRWFAAGFDDGTVRVWDMNGVLHHELSVSDEHLQNHPQNHLHQPDDDDERRIAFIVYASSNAGHSHFASDPHFVLHNHLISADRSGCLREWDLVGGVMVHEERRAEGVNALCVLESVPSSSSIARSYVVAGGKNGTLPVWERTSSTNDKSTWNFLYSIPSASNTPITFVTGSAPSHGARGLLVAGTMDGAVCTYSLESGEPLFVLSMGGVRKSKCADLFPEFYGRPAVKENEKLVADAGDSVAVQAESEGDDEDEGVGNEEEKDEEDKNKGHRGAITDLVVTRIATAGSKNASGEHWLVASSSMDETVRIWHIRPREEGDSDSRTAEKFDRNQQDNQYNHRRRKNSRQGLQTAGLSPGNGISTALLPSLRSSSSSQNPFHNSSHSAIPRGARPPKLEHSLIGVVEQPGARSITLCRTYLCGVRRASAKKSSGSHHHMSAEQPKRPWELWMVDASAEKLYIHTVPLQLDRLYHSPRSSHKVIWKWRTAWPIHFSSPVSAREHKKKSEPTERENRRNQMDGSMFEQARWTAEELEAERMLPFSYVRQVVPVGGGGVACDFGNFVKVVWMGSRAGSRDESSRWKR